MSRVVVPNAKASHTSMRIMGEKSSALHLARGRINLLAAFFFLAYMVVAGRLIDVTVIRGHFLSSGDAPAAAEPASKKEEKKNQRRADIVDRNGVILASSLKTASLYADQKHMADPVATAKALAQIFPEQSYASLLKKVQGKKRFVWIKRNLTPDEQAKILQVGDPGLSFQYDYRRVYPQGAMTSHFVGMTDVDNNGLAGVERSFDKLLKESSEPLKLTLDMRLQHIIRRELQTAINDFTALGGAGIIMDAENGEVLAAVSLPDFDPQNTSLSVTDTSRFNRVTQGVYELGSTFKIFTVAALLETHKASMNMRFDASKPLHRGRFKISDYHPENRALSVPETFMVSSNIATALMAERVGTNAMKNFYRDLGFMKRMDFDINETASPLMPNPWREISTLTAAYGHGIAVTPLHLASATAAVVNGGLLVHPHLIMRDEDEQKPGVRVYSKETSLKMRQLLRLVVEGGTGSKANIKGYRIGGKTGTSEKNINGRYVGDKRVSSFVGAFPIDNPRYVVMVMVDEPHPNKKSYGYATAGWVAVPAVAKIVSNMGPLLNIKPVADDMPDLAEPLKQFVTLKEGH